ncbi:E3 ubiquitin ligase family protein [Candidatus Micrarchaeota archaeon]|nr:E3 ubiquitin ligase family protein [Candidatus Micrarchaeota archaeon]
MPILFGFRISKGLILSGAVIVSGLALFYHGFQTYRRVRLIENIPTSDIRSLAMGLVEITGKAVQKVDLKSPLIGKPCVYSRIEIQELRQQGKHSSWVTIHEKEQRENFYVRDATGQVEIDPREAQIEIPPDRTCSLPGKQYPKEIEQYCEKEKIPLHKPFFTVGPLQLGGNPSRKLNEWFIEAGDAVYVMGTAAQKNGAESAKQEDRIIITKGMHHPFFYISDKTEKETIKGLKRNSYWFIGGGAALAIVGLALLLTFGSV